MDLACAIMIICYAIGIGGLLIVWDDITGK